ncbi:zinc finger protein 62-like [Contarinia nasturtii]|uniref:zinc finger protein 62-like n=1 Tax=Contarinia nasturtii TaxID=265458 RepID=UPI0012D42DC7|nr:zinc finger protein 62-like [Contarinia nasturtii]
MWNHIKNNQTNLCRLCLTNQKQTIDTCANVTPDNVIEILVKYFGEIDETDPLPKHVCLDCWTIVDRFHQFISKVQHTQAKYLSNIVKVEEPENHIVEPYNHDILEPIHFEAVAPSTSDTLGNLILIDEGENKTKVKIEYDISKNESVPVFIEEDSTPIGNVEVENTEAIEDDINDVKSSEPRENTDNSDDEPMDIVYERPKTRYHTYKKELICDICTMVICTKQKLLEHLLRHVRNKCQICNLRCESKYALNIHKRKEHGFNADVMADLLKQLETLKAISKKSIYSDEINPVLLKHYNSSCDLCTKSIPLSLDASNAHYQEEHQTDGYIICCNFKFSSSIAINEHALFHLYPEVFRCGFCNKVIDKARSMRKHISRHLGNMSAADIHKCQTCYAIFTSKNLLNVHSTYFHGMEGNSNASNHTLADFFTMRCDLCDDAKFISYQDARLHYSMFHGITGYLICCNRKFMKAKTIDDHFQWHTRGMVFTCEQCDKQFSDRQKFINHKSHHKIVDEKRFLCCECDKAFHSNHALKRHSQKHKKRLKKSLSCSHCSKRYTTQKALDDHIQFHHVDNGMSGVVCEFCGKKFIARSTLKNHIQVAHNTNSDAKDSKEPPEEFKCWMCPKIFINKYRLKKHVDTIHNGTPVKCSMCDKIAPNEAALACHMRSVHVAQKHQCHLCPKTFKAAVALKDHIATHTGEKTYKCSFCPEAFIWRPNMYSHQKKAHPEEWKQTKQK